MNTFEKGPEVDPKVRRGRLRQQQGVPAGSAEARARFPGLDHTTTLRDLTVIADTGDVYVSDGA